MKIDRGPMPEQDALARARNFAEVNLGYTEQLAILEADRCLQCPKPYCIDGCPVAVNIPNFIRLLGEGNVKGAADSLLDDNALPCVTGRVCPQETQCEQVCLRAKKGKPVAIGYLERFVADWAITHTDVFARATGASGKKVAIVGSGPAGLTAAGELVKRGHDVTIFEAFHAAGGVLIYGIPEFRLPKDIVQKEVDRLVADGVKIEPNSIIGKTYTLPELREKFDAVFVAVGAGLPVFMNVPGENLKGVYSANEYLTRVNLMGAYNPDSDTPVLRGQRVAVVGGGNVAMDSVRTARRLGADESMFVYRRSRTELPARIEEVHHAEQEGVRFEFLTAPVEVLGDEKGWVTGLQVHPHGARRARRLRPAPPDRDPRLRVRLPVRDGRGGDRHASRTRCSPPRRRTCASTSGATSRSTTTSRRRCRASSPAATSSAARPRSSWPWATARRPPAHRRLPARRAAEARRGGDGGRD